MWREVGFDLRGPGEVKFKMAAIHSARYSSVLNFGTVVEKHLRCHFQDLVIGASLAVIHQVTL